MRLTVILLIAFVLNAGARGTAQTVTLEVRDMPLEKVCKQIERQTGYYFVYARDMNKEGHLITVRVDHADIRETLRKVFEHSPFSYQIIDKVVVVNTARAAVPERKLATINPEEKYFKVTGVVLSDQGQPLSEASVKVKTTGKIVLTNIRGEFSATVPENAELIITYVGFESQTVPVKDGTFVQVRMVLAKTELDAMVIKGYYSTSNRLNTGDVSTLKAEDIQKQPVTDPLQAMEGRIPGLYIQQASGMPGAYSSIYLRGQNSMIDRANKPVTLNDPLFIVDGVPFSTMSLTNPSYGGGAVGVPTNARGQGMSPFNSLNPADIESIEVLKDADATAIYGSRGANGVILITTKKGKIGQTRVDADLYSGFSKIAREYKLLNTQQYLTIRREYFRNDQTTPNPNADYDLTFWDTTRYTDWQKVLIGNPAHFNNAQLSISGGDAKTQFLLSGGYSNQGTVFPGNYGDKKASVHVSISHNSADQRFKLQMNAGYVHDDNNLPLADFTGSILLPLNAPKVYNDDGSLNWQLKNGNSTWSNPMAATNNIAKAGTDNLISNLFLSYRILKDLQISNNFGYMHAEMNQSMLQFATAAPPPLSNGGYYNRGNIAASGDYKSWNIEPQLSYRHQLGQATIEALVGATFQASSSKSYAQSVSGYLVDALVSNPAAAAIVNPPRFGYSQYKYDALFSRISLNWDQKYILNLTGRRDGSSRFGPSRQFGNFGAVGVAWIFSKEKFFEGLPCLSFGKIRMSYGVTGNDNLTDYQFMSTYSVAGNTYQGIATIAPQKLTNPYYSWEKNTKWEAGLELGIFKDKILLSASYYRNRTGNQLVGYPLPNLTGFSTVQYNLPAIIENTGLEFSVNTVNIKGPVFNWTSSFNMSIPQNKLVSYPNIQNSSYKYTYQVGKSLFVRYLYHFAGVDPMTGLYTFANKKGNGSLQYGVDQVFTKAVTQKLYGGWQNSFDYKGFELDIFFQFVKQLGNNIYSFLRPTGRMFNQPAEVLNRWQKPGDRTYIVKASALTDLTIQTSDAIISDASFVRLKNVALSYQVPAAWVSKAHLKKIQLYFQGQNLLTITKYRGVDPESQGLSLPPMKTFTVGLRLSM